VKLSRVAYGMAMAGLVKARSSYVEADQEARSTGVFVHTF